MTFTLEELQNILDIAENGQNPVFLLDAYAYLLNFYKIFYGEIDQATLHKVEDLITNHRMGQ
jgi:hypothetical protein